MQKQIFTAEVNGGAPVLFMKMGYVQFNDGSNQLSVNFDSANPGNSEAVIAYGSIDIDDYANFSDLLIRSPIIITGHFYCLILMVILILI